MRLRWLCVLAATLCIGLPAPAQDSTGDTALLLDMLSHPAPGHRTRAAAALEGQGAAAVPALAEEVRSGPIGRALPAAVVLLRLETRAAGAADVLVPLLTSPCEDWRWNVALQVLGIVAPAEQKASLPAILAGLRGGPLRQHAAVQALTALGPDAAEAAPALEQLLLAPRFSLQGVLLNRGVIDKQSVAWTYPTRAYDGLRIVEAMIAVGAPAEAVTPHLLAMTASDLPSLRLRSAGLLLQSGTPESHGVAVAALASLLDDDRYGIPEAALQSLGAAGPAAAPVAGQLARMLGRPEANLRHEAAVALGQMGPAASAALPALRRAADMQRVVEPTGAKVYLDAIALIEN